MQGPRARAKRGVNGGMPSDAAAKVAFHPVLHEAGKFVIGEALRQGGERGWSGDCDWIALHPCEAPDRCRRGPAPWLDEGSGRGGRGRSRAPDMKVECRLGCVAQEICMNAVNRRARPPADAGYRRKRDGGVCTGHGVMLLWFHAGGRRSQNSQLEAGRPRRHSGRRRNHEMRQHFVYCASHRGAVLRARPEGRASRSRRGRERVRGLVLGRTWIWPFSAISGCRLRPCGCGSATSKADEDRPGRHCSGEKSLWSIVSEKHASSVLGGGGDARDGGKSQQGTCGAEIRE